jgi:hypothetical protein
MTEATPPFLAIPVSVVSFLFLATLPGLLHWLILRDAQLSTVQAVAHALGLRLELLEEKV